MTKHRLLDERLLLIIFRSSVHHCSSVYFSFPCCSSLFGLLFVSVGVNIFPCSFLLVLLFFFLSSYFLLIYLLILFRLFALHLERVFCDL